MLTDTQARGAKPTDRPRKRTDARGLFLLATPTGGRHWPYGYSFESKRRTRALGVFPDVSLAMARPRHREARRLLSDGIDPGAAKHVASKDFEAVAGTWHNHWKVGRTGHYAQSVKTRLETDIFPQIGSRPIADISPSDFRDAVRKIEKRRAFEIARRLLQR